MKLGGSIVEVLRQGKVNILNIIAELSLKQIYCKQEKFTCHRRVGQDPPL
jgi:hypothetical protein